MRLRSDVNPLQSLQTKTAPYGAVFAIDSSHSSSEPLVDD